VKATRLDGGITRAPIALHFFAGIGDSSAKLEASKGQTDWCVSARADWMQALDIQ
jgi:hypothetical protein